MEKSTRLSRQNGARHAIVSLCVCVCGRTEGGLHALEVAATTVSAGCEWNCNLRWMNGGRTCHRRAGGGCTLTHFAFGWITANGSECDIPVVNIWLCWTVAAGESHASHRRGRVREERVLAAIVRVYPSV
jgi:hypothetical protein